MKDKVIGIFSPANPMTKIDNQLVRFGIDHLESLGFKVKFAKNAYAENNYTAGSIKERVDDIHQLYLDPEVTLLMSAYGGYNSNQLLDYLDYGLIKENPKPMIGYSDVTALLNGIYAKTNIETMHGPSFISFANPTIFDDFLTSFISMVDRKENIKLVNSLHYASDEWYLKKDFKPRDMHLHQGWMILKPADSSGILIGGNLETFLALIGTEYLPACQGKILLIESTENNPAKFDRDITQLKQVGILDKINGLIIGQFPVQSQLNNAEVLEKIILENTKNKSYPILYNANFSHTDPLYTLPIGGKVEIKSVSPPFVVIPN